MAEQTLAHTDVTTIVSDSSSGAFEGPEKLLEIWFAPTAQYVVDRALEVKGSRQSRGDGRAWSGLRQVDRAIWDGMLDEVQCKVLSVIEGDEVDAYLLSESSMFVWPHKLILKTCGTTTTLLGLHTLLKIASEICSLHSVYRCFYSRKTFMFPDQQRGPHKDWTLEMGFLDQLFDNSSAYTVGKMNGDHWLLYLTPPQDQGHAFTVPTAGAVATPPSLLASFTASLAAALPRALLPPAHSMTDQTLEILMSRLDPAVCAAFYHPSSVSDTTYTSPLLASDPSDADAHALGAALSDRLGLSALLPRATIDSFLFTPCGFSSNAVQGDRYATIHVTPEVDFSYASYETNLSFVESSGSIGEVTVGGHEVNVAAGEPRNVQELVEKVLQVFKPAKFSITLFISMDDADPTSPSLPLNTASSSRRDVLLSTQLVESKYALVDRIVYEFEGYSLLYVVYEAIVPRVAVVVAQ